MRRAVFAIPGDLDTPTGGYAYDKRIIRELRGLGWHIDVLDLGNSFPFPDAAARARASVLLNGIEAGSVVVIDGLAYGVLADEAMYLGKKVHLVALVHHPLALEAGLDVRQMQELRASEIAALGHASAVIVTSEPTRAIVLEQYRVPSDRIHVVLPGVDRPVQPREKRARDPVRLLSVGSLIERKGYDILLQALAQLKDLPWRLVIAGDMTRDLNVSARLTSDIARLGLGDRIELTGAVSAERLQALYADADVFVLASRFEGYGMVFGEAIAAGLPIVGTDVGAAREMAGPAGRIVTPGDATSLKSALRDVIASRDTRVMMAEAAMERAGKLPEWRRSGEQFAKILERLI